MANEFLDGVKAQQFIKQNNEQLGETLTDVFDGIGKSLSSLVNNSTKITNDITKIEKSSSSISSIDNTLKKMYKLQMNEAKKTDKIKTSSKEPKKEKKEDTVGLVKSLKTFFKKESKAKATPKEKKDFFKKGEGKDVSLLRDIKKGLLGRKKEDKGKRRGLLGGIGMLMATGGILGWLMTGNTELLNNVLKGGRYMAKAIMMPFKAVDSLIKGVKSIGLFKAVGKIAKMTKKFGLKGLLRGSKTLTKGLGKGLGKGALKKIPGIGAIMGLVFGIQKWKKGDKIGALLEFASGGASIFPGIGTAISVGIDLFNMKRDFSMSKADKKAQNAKFFGGGRKRGVVGDRPGGGGFDIDNNDIKNGNTLYGDMYYEDDDDILQLKESLIDRVKKLINDDVPIGKDDNHTTTSSTSKSGYWASLKKLNNSKYKKYMQLNPTAGMRPDLTGLNPKMKSKFFKMAEEFNRSTRGGKFLVNSAFRPEKGSVHGKGYAIDVNALDKNGKRWGDGYVPDALLKKYGFHKPLLKLKSWYGGKKDEPWHIEPFPGEDVYGSKRNTLAPDNADGVQPYREGVLLAGKNGYGETGGGGFNLPQGNIESKKKEPTNMSTKLDFDTIKALAGAIGEQIRTKTPVPTNNIMPSSSNGRSM